MLKTHSEKPNYTFVLKVLGVILSIISASSQSAQLNLSDNPLFLTSATTPITMLNISKDHQLYFKAFDDYSDLDGDGTPETTYKHSFDYYGYFDSYKCYNYNTTNLQFEPSANTSTKYCSNSWSGNFLNWASMTRIDTIRKILYGGLRAIDDGSSVVSTSNTTTPATSNPSTSAPVATSSPVTSAPSTSSPVSTTPVASAATLYSTDSSTHTQNHLSFCSTSGAGTTTSAESLVSSSNGTVTNTTPTNSTPTDSTPTNSSPVSTTPTNGSTTTTVDGEDTISSYDTTYTTSYNTTYNTTYNTSYNSSYQKTDIKQYTVTTVQITCSGSNDNKTKQTTTTINTYRKTYTSTVTTTTTTTTTTPKKTVTTTTTSTTTTTVTGPNHGYTVLERSYLPNDAHSFAKFYNGSDLTELTPFSSTDVSGGITLCNTTVSSTVLSQNVTDPPLIRVAKGNYSLWAANERWQCRWSEEKAASNSNSSTDSGINAQSSNPSKSDKGLGSKDYVAKVKVCDFRLIGTENCKIYPDNTDTRKPIGLLQTYGDDGKLRFGLMTGSYGKNKSGGVLRKNVSVISDEINVTSNGTFKSAPSTGGIINTLNKLRIYGYRNDDGTYFGVTGSAGCSWGLNSFNNGVCNNWGNPQSEIMLESLRYLAGKSASTTFSVDDTAYISGLISATPSDPVIPAQWCATQSVIQFNASTSSYDGDELSGVTDLGASDMNTLTNAVGEGEKINGKNFFIGENGTDNNQICTAKTVSNLSTVRGTCPDSPRLSGTYHIAGLADYAHTNDIRSDVQDKQLVTTYGVALSPQVPKVVVNVPGSTTKTITILPACQNTDSAIKGNCTIVDFKIVSQSSTDTTRSGKLYINWEDSEQGGDFDQDEWGVLSYSITSTQVSITTDVIAQSTPYKMGFGYVISGTTTDGFHAHSGINSYSYTDPQGTLSCSGCTSGNSATTATYTIGSSSALSLQQPLYYAAKWGSFTDANNNDIPDIKSEWDADDDDQPDHYFFAIDPKSLETSLKSALDDVLKRTAAASSAAANSTGIQSGTMLYQAQFNSTDWSGHLFDFPVSNTGAVKDVNNDKKLDETDANWDAGTLIPTSSRNIYTFSSSAGTTFFWDNLSSSQRTALQTSSTGVLGTVDDGSNRLNWLRGDTNKERRNGGSLRNRESTLLGDIINSDPVYTKTEDYGFSKLPNTTPGQSSYEQYVEDKTTGTTPRTPMIYAGANDGMLHGFRADIGNSNSGKEILAYVPAAVYANLSKLTEPSYSHTYYVDGSPTISDAYLNGTWKTILVGGLNKGGKSIYALNISNPVAFNAGIDVLWEYQGSTNTDTANDGSDTIDADGMGFTYSQPQIGLLKDGTWAVIFGNGYNSVSEKAFLYVVNLSTGALIKKIPTNSSTSNGLSTPKLYDSDGDKIIDYVYAGDLQGNLWKFDFNSTSQSAWSLGNGGAPLFTASITVDGVTTAQPITSQPTLGDHSDGGVLVFFGTGRYLTSTDVTNLDVQSFYAIWDKPSTTGTVNRSSLQAQSITTEITAGTTKTIGNCTDDTSTPINECLVTFQYPVRGTSSNTVDYTSKRGWFMDLLPSTQTPSGERVVSSGVIMFDRIIFVTIIPSTDPCVPGGTSWLMEVDFKTGGATAISSFDFNSDDQFDSKDTLPSGSTGSGIGITGGMADSALMLDRAGTNKFVKELSLTDTMIMDISNKKPVTASTGTPKRLYWLQIQ
ncbi:PilC/PilY family type IV pilus protein [Methylomonas sp. UP202]|uniref:PilC/PilY family type IV pilus protein n=1 Tax=Methylomonas sp. UP202 TaxID=3040943 RepID=UPI002479D7F6|nr:PilC/PilY family type IV pilus protein [Methylomonas sp. UP202]WGS87943.1 PilC/PilY family type IV pilus protein [Methylomonas sp. UP202]